jgi:glycosyltransferase involved in cell wall biosynthesis
MLISIITVNLDNAAGLERTIASVLRQSGAPIDFIVIDGASSDGSREILERFSPRFSHWVSEKDSGIYQAMNKGITVAKGDYCLFLNSGDWLVSDTIISEVAGKLQGQSDIYYSNLLVSDGTSHYEIKYPPQIDVNYFVSSTISHQNCLIRTQFLKDAEMYREDFLIAADWYFFLDAIYRRRASFEFLDAHIAFYYFEGRSNSPRFEEIKKREHEVGIRAVFGELAPSILALMDFRQSLYGSTIRLYGDSQILRTLIRGYRFIAKHLGISRRIA